MSKRNKMLHGGEVGKFISFHSDRSKDLWGCVGNKLTT